MEKKELRRLSKEKLVDLLRMYGEDSASTLMPREELVEMLINYDDVVHDLFPHDI